MDLFNIMENSAKVSTMTLPNDCLLQQMSDELEEANIIIKRVFEKYKLNYNDIELHPLNDNISLVIRMDYLLDRQDTPLTSELSAVFGHNKK